MSDESHVLRRLQHLRLDPRGYFGGRYNAESRWVDILAAETGWTICNMGQNGREIASTAPDLPADTDLLIVMLGTNDLLQGRSPVQSAERLEWLLSDIFLDPSKILLDRTASGNSGSVGAQLAAR